MKDFSVRLEYIKLLEDNGLKVLWHFFWLWFYGYDTQSTSHFICDPWESTDLNVHINQKQKTGHQTWDPASKELIPWSPQDELSTYCQASQKQKQLLAGRKNHSEPLPTSIIFHTENPAHNKKYHCKPTKELQLKTLTITSACRNIKQLWLTLLDVKWYSCKTFWHILTKL